MPNQAMQRTLRARHELCCRTSRAVPYASLILFSLDGMNASEEKRSSPWWLGVAGVFSLAFGAFFIVEARDAATRHIVIRSGYKSGYAPMEPWQLYGVGGVLLIVGMTLLLPALRRVLRRPAA